jgi:hypothetical protein
MPLGKRSCALDPDGNKTNAARYPEGDRPIELGRVLLVGRAHCVGARPCGISALKLDIDHRIIWHYRARCAR